ncbi:MAG: PDZ domain-containing protein [Erysipelotrichia bacterium]|nr:PDZ domain-containing protein [Erysipelotrichia bacterium]
MDENKDEKADKSISEENDPIHRIPIKRHLWPEEVEAKKLRHRNSILQTALIFAILFCLASGWCLGSIHPIRLLANLQTLDSDSKINEVLNIMTNDWYFSKDIDNPEERLTDQALTGMTSNSEDTHTEYMSREEIESFKQSINRNFVGIGITYIAVDGQMPIVERVLKGSPSEKAGVQPGDIIEKIDGASVEGKTSSEIADMCKGESGTTVAITFARDGEDITLDIVRREIAVTVYGEIKDNQIGSLEIVQFGDTTADEVKAYLDEFKDAGVTKLILDLRDDGGGYLNDLQGVAGYFVPKGTEIMKEVFRDDTVSRIVTDKQPYDCFHQIVLLVNQNTASAAEVFTLAMKECRDDVTIIGTTTYGKGTVQITKYFSDGSALKYTEAKWISPSGVWVNGTGITPDITVKLHDVLYTKFTMMEDTESYAVDSVSDYVKEAQLALDYLGYSIDRMDGYFSASAEDAVRQFQTDKHLEVTGILDSVTYQTILSDVIYDWNTSDVHDLQYARAMEVLNG